MDIISRLKMFLQQSGIANSQFADNCEIPRPTLSQLLNGRNKKVSDEVIAKIHRAYPNLNIMWLMFGDGDMLVPNANIEDSFSTSQPRENSAAAAVSGSHSQPKTISFGSIAVDENQSAGNRYSPSASPRTMAEAMQHMAQMSRMMPQSRSSKSRTGDESRVVSIMVFYSDGRFETFAPQL